LPDEEGNKPDDFNQIFGTYINKDSSEKPDGVKKMLKVRTPQFIGYLFSSDLNLVLQANTLTTAT